MMAQAAPLLLLLLLQLMASQGQEFMKYWEGQTLKVTCRYTPERGENRWKTWCKERRNGNCERLITGYSGGGVRSDLRASLQDDISSGTITITMSKLMVQDSGTYWCGIYDSFRNTVDILKTIRVEVSPATILRTTKRSPPTTETPVTTSASPLATSSSRDNQKFIIWGSVLVSLLLVGLLSAGILYTMKISRKPVTEYKDLTQSLPSRSLLSNTPPNGGDDDCHHVYDDLEEQKKKARDITIEMQEEDSEVIQYASVIHGTQLSLGDSIYANTQMGYNLGSNPIPSETVEYASIEITGRQLPK